MEGLKCIRSILILVPSFKPERKQLRWCKMDSWVVGQISFWYTVYEVRFDIQLLDPVLLRCIFPKENLTPHTELQVKPAAIVDKLISFWIDIVTPGRGAGEANWCVFSIRWGSMLWGAVLVYLTLSI